MAHLGVNVHQGMENADECILLGLGLLAQRTASLAYFGAVKENRIFILIHPGNRIPLNKGADMVQETEKIVLTLQVAIFDQDGLELLENMGWMRSGNMGTLVEHDT